MTAPSTVLRLFLWAQRPGGCRWYLVVAGSRVDVNRERDRLRKKGFKSFKVLGDEDLNPNFATRG